VKIDRIEDILRRVETALRDLASDNRDFQKQVTELTVKIATLDGRVANLPSTWQIIAILAALLFGVSGIAFTAARFMHP